jgi:hypothetical protein
MEGVMKKSQLLIERILFAVALAILFLPLATMQTGGGTAALNGFTFIFGKNITIDVAGISMDVGSVKGNFGLIFLILIPIGFEVISIVKQNFTKLSAVLLSVFGLIMSFVLFTVAGNNQLIKYKLAEISPAALAHFLTYPAALVFSIIVAIKNRTPKVRQPKISTPRADGENVMAGHTPGPIISDETAANIGKFAKGAATEAAKFAGFAGKKAAELGGKAKDAAATLAASDVKKASNVAEQLRTYKELLDSGVITAEEFDAKKKEILE